jgi:hypothetical protein
MVNTIFSKEKFRQDIGFDEFNILVTALKRTGSDRWQRIINFSHVIRDKETGKMLEMVRTMLYFDDFLALHDMDLRLRYDHELLDECLDNMEDYTTEMLKRDTEFYRNLNKSPKLS